MDIQNYSGLTSSRYACDMYVGQWESNKEDDPIHRFGARADEAERTEFI